MRSHMAKRWKSPIVRAMMLRPGRTENSPKAGVGVRIEIIFEALVQLLNQEVHPIVKSGGSVGQADIAEWQGSRLVVVSSRRG